MDWSSIVVAIITGGMALLGTIISNYRNNSKTLYRIEQLEKKQDKHNSVIERVFLCEETNKVHEERIQNLKEQLEYLKKQ